LQEEMKTLPFGDVWDEYCKECGVAEDGAWFGVVKEYENSVLKNRGN